MAEAWGRSLTLDETTGTEFIEALLIEPIRWPSITRQKVSDTIFLNLGGPGEHYEIWIRKIS